MFGDIMKYRLQFPLLIALMILSLNACRGTQIAPPPTTAPSAIPATETPAPSPTFTATETSVPEGTPTDSTPLSTPELASTNTLPPDTFIIWPDLSTFALFPAENAFRNQDGGLFAGGLRQGQDWTSSSWNLPGAFYNEEDMVYVSGYLRCTQNGQPVSCVYGSFGWQVGGGDQNGIFGTPGFRWNLNQCMVLEDEDEGMTLHFDCAQPADRGFEAMFDYIWLRVFSGQGGQLHDVHVSFFGIDWSGVMPTPTP
jgi:hypothetical protein